MCWDFVALLRTSLQWRLSKACIDVHNVIEAVMGNADADDACQLAEKTCVTSIDKRILQCVEEHQKRHSHKTRLLRQHLCNVMQHGSPPTNHDPSIQQGLQHVQHLDALLDAAEARAARCGSSAGSSSQQCKEEETTQGCVLCISVYCHCVLHI